MSDLKIPVATYRLQLNAQARFRDACNLVPYLHQLAISDLYASPILKAREGSSHGYDVTDPTLLNPELGTMADFNLLVRELQIHQMGLLLDIVPNHMAASSENPWWMDVLENGLCSPFANFFDIDWDILNNRILLPILTCPYEDTLKSHDFFVTLDDTGLFIQYKDYRLPLNVESYRLIITYCLDSLWEALGPSHPDYRKLSQLMDSANAFSSVSKLDPAKATEQYRDRRAAKESLLNIVKMSPKIKEILLQGIAQINSKKEMSEDFNIMHNIVDQQIFQLDYWKTALEHLNYRRFFDISDLVGVRVEESSVFEASHSLILKLVRQGKVSGLRIDHIDGLNDPLQYLLRLQQYVSPKSEEAKLPHLYVVVEKILTSNETLPSGWPVFGTTGYDFAKAVNALFADKRGVKALDDIYFRFTDSKITFSRIVYEKKKQIIEELFPSEVHALVKYLINLAQRNSLSVMLSASELTEVLIQVTAWLPVYRTYIRTMEVSPQDQIYIEYAIEKTRRNNSDIDITSLDFLKKVLTLELPEYLSCEQKQACLDFILRWQQFTGAVMAKGFEDTSLYCYNHLISLNDVGSGPDSLAFSVDDFHKYIMARKRYWPYSLNTTSTHDTKRSEDVRSRINVLSEIPEEWDSHLTQWRSWNSPKKQLVNGLSVPEPNIEILIYQTLIGAWPHHENQVLAFKQRLKEYMVKAVREAKIYTNWLSPDQDYESALLNFLELILYNSKESDFFRDFLPFVERISYYGALNSLAQVLLKITSPGIPDFYQGTELWDFSLVDPDNRRPVDFKACVKVLDELTQYEVQGQEPLIQQILNSWDDGRVKLYVTYKGLNVRRSFRNLFQDGEYIPLRVVGKRQNHVCSFMRRRCTGCALVVTPRLLTKLINVGSIPVGREVWKSDLLILPANTPRHWLNVFTGEKLEVFDSKNGLKLADVLNRFPIALLIGI